VFVRVETTGNLAARAGEACAVARRIRRRRRRRKMRRRQ
jgi:hypothetical protein